VLCLIKCINSVDRKWLNQKLLEVADKNELVSLHFKTSLESAQFDDRTLTLKSDEGTKLTVKNVDLVLGCDGAYSKVRSLMMRQLRMDYSQTYIDHAYVELSMPPTADGEYQMSPDGLHIWPRQSFMMIALPNQDKSFTVTLFMPWEKFEAIKTPDDLLEFFDTTFPDSVPLLGKTDLVADYFKNEKGPLISIKVSQVHKVQTIQLQKQGRDSRRRSTRYGSILYSNVTIDGQGMNCGFEDVLVLDEVWTKLVGSKKFPDSETLEQILTTYSKTRNPDAEAMCDLALYNYIEMRSSVTKSAYLIRKKVEGFLHKLFPTLVIPLYTMVSFSRIPYAQAMERFNLQTKWFDGGMMVARVVKWGAIGGVLGWLGLRMLGHK
jgi:kynurenine 3-monooxygenase